MKSSPRIRKLAVAVLAVVFVGIGFRHHARASEAAERDEMRGTTVWVDLLAFRIIPAWWDLHPGADCPTAVASLTRDTRRDSWGGSYRLTCESRKDGRRARILVRSAGPDRELETADDIWSYGLDA